VRLSIVIITVPGRNVLALVHGRACEQSECGTENEAERAENRLERSGERAKSAAQNPLHHKTTQSKNLKIDFER